MKIISVCLMVLLTCSCCRDTDNLDQMKRKNEVLKIMRESWIHDLENSNLLTTSEHNELRRMKKNYYAKVKNRTTNPLFVIPGRGWEIRGPLTVTQVEEEIIESRKESLKKRENVNGLNEISEEFSVHWGNLRDRYIEGDELYFFRSDKRSWRDLCGRQGYVLIRENKMVDHIVTLMN